MRVGILGDLEVTAADGAVIDVPGGRLRALMTWLALDAGRRVSTESLFDLLWQDERPAPNALQSLVSRLRRVLGDATVIESAAGGYRLPIEQTDVDVRRFELLAERGRAQLASGQQRAASASLGEALALWRGPALADVADSPAAAAAISRLEAMRLSAMQDRIGARIALGEHASALADLQALCQQEPLREPLRALQMQALYACGRQAEALAVYDELRRRLADELGVDPSEQLRELHVAMLRGDLSPSAADETTPQHNLPASLTSFIGREDEQQLIAKRLEEFRLVTLVGPGGSGKTRLAVEVGHRLVDQYPDGAWLVELAPITNPADIPQVVVESLGLQENRVLERSGRQRRISSVNATTRLLEGLGDKRTLILLDNCEHLIRGAAELAELVLTRCPGVRVLATSREPLAIGGESLCAVPPLGLPPADATAAEAARYPAIALFVGRACAARADFELSDECLAPVLEICRRLDGLPLAIELAAARMRTMTVGQIAERLGDRFRLLTGGSRTALPRQQTLRAVVSWSWDLLDGTERTVAERFGIFAGGATATSVAQICQMDELVIEDVLTSLAEKSLLDVSDEGERRYRMLETLREYGVEQLAEGGEIVSVRQAHARMFLELAERAEPHLRRAEQVEWIDRLNTERDNILAALRYAINSGDADVAVRIGAALAWYWTLRDTHSEAASWLGAILELPGASPPVARGLVLGGWAMSQIAFTGPDACSPEVLAALDELRTMPDRLGDDAHPLISLLPPLMSMMVDGRKPGSEAVFARYRDHPDPWLRAAVHLMRAMLDENEGVVDPERHDLRQALSDFRQVGDRWGISAVLQALGGLDAADGNLAAAMEQFAEASQLMAEFDAGDDLGHLQARAAAIKAHLGDVDGALRDLGLAVERGQRAGSHLALAQALITRSTIRRRMGDLAGARRDIAAAGEHTRHAAFAPPQVTAWLAGESALVELAAGDPAEARRQAADSVRAALDSRDMPVLSRSVFALVELARRSGDPAQAALLLGVARNVRGMDDQSDADLVDAAPALRGELGEDGFCASYDEGVAMTRADALALLAERASALAADPPSRDAGQPRRGAPR